MSKHRHGRPAIFPRILTWLLIDAIFITVLFLAPDIARPPSATFVFGHMAGLVIATVVLFSGIGGGVLWFPVFTWLGVPPADAVALSLITQAAGTGSGTLRYLRAGMVDRRLAGRLLPAALAGVTAGFALAMVLPPPIERGLLLLFAGTVLWIFVGFARGTMGRRTRRRLSSSPVLIAAGSSLFTGLLGLGNSMWLIPYMSGPLRLPMRRAVATGMAIVFGSAVWYLLLRVAMAFVGGQGWPEQAPLLWATCSGVILGAPLGVALARVDTVARFQRPVFGALLLLSALDMVRVFIVTQ